MDNKEIQHLQETGLTRRQLAELFGVDSTNKFLAQMKGQTVGVAAGLRALGRVRTRQHSF